MTIVRENTTTNLKVAGSTLTQVKTENAEMSHVYIDGTLVYAAHVYEDLTTLNLTDAQAQARRDDANHGTGWVLWHDTNDATKPTLLTLGSQSGSNGGIASSGYRAATCTTAGYHNLSCTCSGCNWTRTYEVADALGHLWGDWVYGDWVIDTAATCTTAGSKHRSKTHTCQRDSSHTESGTDTESIDALGHSMTYNAAVAATCTTAGNIAYYHCSQCGKNFSDSSGTNELSNVTIPATGHSPASVWSSNANGHWHVCNNGCETLLDYAAHTAGTPTVEDGYRITRCSVCSYEISRVAVSPQVGDIINAGILQGTIRSCGTSLGLCIEGTLSAGTFTAKNVPITFWPSGLYWYSHYACYQLTSNGTCTYPDGTYFSVNYVPSNGAVTYRDGSSSTAVSSTLQGFVVYSGNWYLITNYNGAASKDNGAALAARTPFYSSNVVTFKNPYGTIYNFDTDSSFYCIYAGCQSTGTRQSGVVKPAVTEINRLNWYTSTASGTYGSFAITDDLLIRDASNYSEYALGTAGTLSWTAQTVYTSALTYHALGETTGNRWYSKLTTVPNSSPWHDSGLASATINGVSGHGDYPVASAAYTSSGALTTAQLNSFNSGFYVGLAYDGTDWWWFFDNFSIQYYGVTRFVLTAGSRSDMTVNWTYTNF